MNSSHRAGRRECRLINFTNSINFGARQTRTIKCILMMGYIMGCACFKGKFARLIYVHVHGAAKTQTINRWASFTWNTRPSHKKGLLNASSSISSIPPRSPPDAARFVLCEIPQAFPFCIIPSRKLFKANLISVFACHSSFCFRRLSDGERCRFVSLPHLSQSAPFNPFRQPTRPFSWFMNAPEKCFEKNFFLLFLGSN